MAFQKTADVPIEKILCPCGGEIKDGKCTKCGKEPMVDNPDESQKKKAKE